MLSNLLISNSYDSVNNYITFHDEYMRSGISFMDFFKQYDPPIVPRKHTCVGLGLELIRRMKKLDNDYKDFSKSVSLVSCEESVNKGVRKYIKNAKSPPLLPQVSAEKEHVMVAIQIAINGRPGVMLADPGYHVGRVVTVMFDKETPHTGSFVQHKSKHLVKQFHYFVNKRNKGYVEWHERETKGDRVKYQISLVYIGQPYLSAVEVTEKRNIVYSFKSQLRRDPKGNVIAGYYFPLSDNIETATFTVFIGLCAKAKYYFEDFLDPYHLHPKLVEIFELLSSYMDYSFLHLVGTISKIAKMICNREFTSNVMELNNNIRSVCKSRSSIANVPPLTPRDYVIEELPPEPPTLSVNTESKSSKAKTSNELGNDASLLEQEIIVVSMSDDDLISPDILPSVVQDISDVVPEDVNLPNLISDEANNNIIVGKRKTKKVKAESKHKRNARKRKKQNILQNNTTKKQQTKIVRIFTNKKRSDKH